MTYNSFSEVNIEADKLITNELYEVITLATLLGYKLKITDYSQEEKGDQIFIHFYSERTYLLILYVYGNRTLWKISLFDGIKNELASGLIKLNLRSPIIKLKNVL